ncbi:MAG: universal stress protein [Planctomycetaceae bacterium]|nr:universal stress protein [Planctomycetaceae bacterium]
MIPRFRNILLPLDFTPKNQMAMEVAFEMAVREPAAVTLLHVIETIHDPQTEPDDELQQFYSRLESRAEDELEYRARRFEEAGVRVFRRIRFGPRPGEIVRFADEHTIDLIVMSSHAVDRDHPATSLATISYQVSVLCSCPIMLVKQPPVESGTAD